MLKNLGKYIRMHISILYVLMHSFGKMNIFCRLCKKYNKHVSKKFI
jgi:hypothetical protein